VMDNPKRALAGAGAEHVVCVRIFLTDFERDYTAFNRLYTEYCRILTRLKGCAGFGVPATLDKHGGDAVRTDDSPLERAGFEPSVPAVNDLVSPAGTRVRTKRQGRSRTRVDEGRALLRV